MFKVGDRVVCIAKCTGAHAPKIGEERTVVGVRHGSITVYGTEYNPSFSWFEGNFQLVLEGAGRRSRTLPDDSAARKQYPLFNGPLMYFPAALAAVAKLCRDGNDKHNPGEPMHHARSKSSDHEDTILRHMLDAREGNGCDEHGTPHVVNVAWRALALCQEWLEKHEGAPLAPGARR